MSQNKTFTKGDNATICVFINDDTKMTFSVKVDAYTALQLQGGYSLYTQTYVQFQALAHSTSDNAYTNQTAYYKFEDKIMPVMSLIIELSNGNVASMAWENGCYSCSGSSCFSMPSYFTSNAQDLKYKNCIQTCTLDQVSTAANSVSLCDPKIFVSWMGTDKNGYHMSSASLRISRFQEYSIAQYSASASNIFKNIKSNVPIRRILQALKFFPSHNYNINTTTNNTQFFQKK